MSLCAEKCFSLSDALHELKKQPFSAKQKVFVYRKLYALPSKAYRFHNQNTAIRTTLYCPQKPPSYVQKPIFCTSLSLLVSKTAHFHKPKALLLPKSFLIYYPKQPFSTLRSPFQPPLTYYPQKISIFTNQKSFFYTNPSLIAIPSNPLLPSISHSHPTITYCLQRIRPFFRCSL